MNCIQFSINVAGFDAATREQAARQLESGHLPMQLDGKRIGVCDRARVDGDMLIVNATLDAGVNLSVLLKPPGTPLKVNRSCTPVRINNLAADTPISPAAPGS